MHRSRRQTEPAPGAAPVGTSSNRSDSAPLPALLFRVSSAAATDTGVQREQNEDAFFVDDSVGVYLVCDGMGGHASGQVASELAIRTVAEVMLGDSEPPAGAEPLVAALQAANAAILDRARADPACKGMGTTAVGLRTDGDLVHICHCGDSRCYLLRDGTLRQVTEDHSLENLYKRKPELAGSLGPAQSNVIVRCIGLEPVVEVDHRVMAMEDGDLYLLCCDGLTDLVEDWMLQEIMTSDEELDAMAANLIRAANANGGLDNITVILVRLTATTAGPPPPVADPSKTLPGY